MAIEPESPYIQDNYSVIKDMVLNREAVLNEAATDQASVSGTETETSVIELRRKAMYANFFISTGMGRLICASTVLWMHILVCSPL